MKGTWRDKISKSPLQSWCLDSEKCPSSLDSLQHCLCPHIASCRQACHNVKWDYLMLELHPEQTRFKSRSAYCLKGLDCRWANLNVMPAVTKKQLHGLTQLYWISGSCGRIWQNELQLRMVSRRIRKRVHSNRDPVEFSMHPNLYDLVGQPQQQQVQRIWLKLSSLHYAIL